MKRVCLTLLLISGLVTSAGAKALQFGVGAGLSVPVGDVSSTLDQGVQVQGLIRYQPMGMPFGLKACVNYHRNKIKLAEAGIDGYQSTVSGIGNLSIGMNIGPLRPHVSAGLGAYHITDKTTEAGVDSTQSEIKFGINGAVGVDLRLKSITLYAVARMDNIYTDQGLSASLKDTSTIRFVPVTVGILF